MNQIYLKSSRRKIANYESNLRILRINSPRNPADSTSLIRGGNPTFISFLFFPQKNHPGLLSRSSLDGRITCLFQRGRIRRSTLPVPHNMDRRPGSPARMQESICLITGMRPITITSIREWTHLDRAFRLRKHET